MADTADEASTSLISRLRSAEQHWIWKVALRGVICTLNIIGIGCAAWTVATAVSIAGNPYIGYFDFNSASTWSLIPLCVSFIWCALWIIVPLFLKPPRAIHSGVAVGFDLILWLSFILVGILAVAGVFGIIQYGSDPTYLSDPSSGYGSSDYSGSYYLAPNDTWVYNITYIRNSGDRYYNYTSGEYEYLTTLNASSVERDCSPWFATCADQDVFINRLWQEKPKREGVTVTLCAVDWLNVLLHFILFVWACVDTHRRRRRKGSSKERMVADRIIADLQQRGLISVEDGVVVAVNGNTQTPMTQTHQSPSVAQPTPAHLPPTTHDTITHAR